MEPANPPRDKPTRDSPDDAIAETQALRRKVVFWRRVAWLAVGGAAIVMLVVWTRGQTRQGECSAALSHFAELASIHHLSEQHPAILEQQWQQFDTTVSSIPPEHYDLIVKNWVAAQNPGEDLVLAICRDSHLLLFSSGRHVLKRHGKSYAIEWLSEDAAAPIAAEARKDNHSR